MTLLQQLLRMMQQWRTHPRRYLHCCLTQSTLQLALFWVAGRFIEACRRMAGGAGGYSFNDDDKRRQVRVKVKEIQECVGKKD